MSHGNNTADRDHDHADGGHEDDVMMILMVAIVMVIIVTVSPFTTAIIPEAAALLVLPPSVVDFRCHRMNPGTWSFPSLSPEFLNPG
jgi:hypothetical protein